jgi:carbon-monoxide dehydrogenase iron sulfur subunit
LKRIVVDVKRCLACRSCELACAVAHSASKRLLEAIRETPAPEARVNVEQAGRWGMPLQCRQCDDPACIRVCPTKAITKGGPNEPVRYERDKCIGCAFCVQVCPFGVIRTSRAGGAGVIRCDLCALREGGPACVEACPMEAISFEEVDEAAARARRRTAAEAAGVIIRLEAEKK